MHDDSPGMAAWDPGRSRHHIAAPSPLRSYDIGATAHQSELKPQQPPCSGNGQHGFDSHPPRDTAAETSSYARRGHPERITAQWTDAPHAPTLSHACGWLKYGALFSEFQAFRTAESESRLKPVPALLK